MNNQHKQNLKFSLSIESLVEKFLYYLEYEKNNSPKTLENYSLWLNRFINYIWDIDVTKIKAMHILDYRMYLNSLDLSKKTINYHIVAIRSFLKFCLKNDIDCMSPEKLELSKIPNREINYLLEDEVEKIMQAPFLLKQNDLKRKRDSAILWMLYGTGLRVSELIQIKRSQINPDNKQFSVVWKWSKIRASFLTKKGVKLMTNSPIVKATPDGIVLKDGQEIKTKTLIWTCGVQGNSFIASSGLTPGKRNRVQVNDYMQSMDKEEVYLVGDNAYYEIDGKPIPQIVETAIQTGECAAHNIAADIAKTEKKKFKLNTHGFISYAHTTMEEYYRRA